MDTEISMTVYNCGEVPHYLFLSSDPRFDHDQATVPENRRRSRNSLHVSIFMMVIENPPQAFTSHRTFWRRKR